ncbi:hypothetical protein APA_3976 [Pseudanabaena sp. lw0831]|nr:hypothetical protein APA_3976 [Pseudanabaena sp. lw0831]
MKVDNEVKNFQEIWRVKMQHDRSPELIGNGYVNKYTHQRSDADDGN